MKHHLKKILNDLPPFVRDFVWQYRVYQALKQAKPLINDPVFFKKRSRTFGLEVRDYWNKHLGVEVNPAWHYIYANYTGEEDVRFVATPEWYSQIHPALNEPIFYYPTFGDKNFTDLIFDKSLFPDTVFKRIRGCYYDENNRPISEKEAFDRFYQDETDKIAKPSMSSMGDRILLVNHHNRVLFINNEKSDEYRVSEILGDNYIVQKKIEQYPVLSHIHPDSLNTIRLNTLRLHGSIYHLPALLKIGADGKVNDNYKGGYVCAVDNNGAVSSIGYNRMLERFENHPTTNISFRSLKSIPGFKDIQALCRSLHEQVPHLDFASWDVAVGKNGRPVIVEVNSKPPVFIKQLICRKPFFGDHTEELLAVIKEKRKRKSDHKV